MKHPLRINRPDIPGLKPMTPLQMNSIQFKGAGSHTGKKNSKADSVIRKQN